MNGESGRCRPDGPEPGQAAGHDRERYPVTPVAIGIEGAVAGVERGKEARL